MLILVTPAANFCDQMPGLFHQISKTKKKTFDDMFGKKEVTKMFSKDLCFV
jgi:hypothetical protein